MVRKKQRIVRSMKSSVSHSKLNEFAFANSAGILMVIALFFYAFLVWFGAFDATYVLGQYPIYFSLSGASIVIGIVQSYVMGYVVGWVFAKLYNSSLR